MTTRRLLGWAALFAPPIAVLVAAIWALVTSALLLWWLPNNAPMTEPGATSRLDTIGRVLAACVGYLVAYVALWLLATGLLRRRRRAPRLIAGLVLALPALWFFGASTELAFTVAPLRFLPGGVDRALVLVLLAHTGALAVVAARQSLAQPLPRTTVKLPAVAAPPAATAAAPDDVVAPGAIPIPAPETTAADAAPPEPIPSGNPQVAPDQ